VLADEEIRRAVDAGELIIDPFDNESLQPANYDFRIGRAAFASSTKEKVDVAQKGLIVIEPGDFAVVETLERVESGNQMAAMLGLRSEYARQGLLMLSGPQIDPGFRGVLVIRVVNLAPRRVALPYEAPFLTAQFFRLAEPVHKSYEGARQDQTGISQRDIQELTQTEGLTLGEMMKTLSSLALDVADLRGSVSKLAWVIPLIVGIGIAVIGVIVGVK
jgi:dCTP deaminase